MLTLSVRAPGESPRSVVIEHFPCVIGRSSDADVVLSGWRVSKLHARIDRSDSGYRIADAGSLTGTWVNGERIGEFGPIRTTDEVIIAGYRIGIIEGFDLNGETKAIRQSMFIDAAEDSQLGTGSVPCMDEQAFFWKRHLHQRLLAEIDRRRRDIRQLTDEQLRDESRELLDQVLAEEAGVPEALNQNELIESVLDEAIGLGPLQNLMSDDSVSEIMVNGTHPIYVERAGRLIMTDLRFSSDVSIRAVIDRIVTPTGRHIDESSPMVDTRLPDGSRVNAVIPPIAINGPTITIRRFNRRLLSPADLLDLGSLSAAMLEFLKICVRERCNILIAGGTGSGKTTLLNLLAGFISPDERVITIEDAAELRLCQGNQVALEARPTNVEGKGRVSIRDLVRNALRMRPDRIVVGECRGGEALDMLQAMNTGHEGSLTTIHANGTRDAVSRLEVMALMAGVDIPVLAIREQIASAVQLVIHQGRCPDGARRVLEIAEITGVESGKILMQPIFRFHRSGSSFNPRSGRFLALGNVPQVFERLRDSGVDLDVTMFGGERV